jgi:hypothetical protein
MGSNTKEIREMQKQKLEVRLAARKAELSKQGLSDARQKKDKVLLHLKAEIRRTARAVASIDKMRSIVESAHQKKIENAAKAAAAGPKKKKGTAAPAKDEKKDKKAKKAEKADAPEKAGKPGKPEKAEKSEKTEKAQD